MLALAAGASRLAARMARRTIPVRRSCATPRPSCLFKDMSRPLIEAAGLDPNSVKVVLLNDPEINAFVAHGQTVYLQSGLIEAADNVNQVQGVIAHELGHVAGGDSIRSSSGRAAGDRDHDPVAGARRRGDRRRRRRSRHGHHDGRPAGGAGRIPRLHPRPGSTADAPARAFSRRPGSAARACSISSASCRTRNTGSPIYAKDSYDRTHPLSIERIQALEQKLQEPIPPGTSRPIRRSRRASSG